MERNELRLYKCKLASDKGYKYNPETGEIIGIRGNIVGSKSPFGYIDFYVMDYDNTKTIKIKAHVFGWYYINGSVPDILDHINENKMDNRIINLRPITKQENSFNNSKYKNYSFNKRRQKYDVRIVVNGKNVFRKFVDNEEEAIRLAKEIKTKYHIIKKR